MYLVHVFWEFSLSVSVPNAGVVPCERAFMVAEPHFGNSLSLFLFFLLNVSLHASVRSVQCLSVSAYVFVSVCICPFCSMSLCLCICLCLCLCLYLSVLVNVSLSLSLSLSLCLSPCICPFCSMSLSFSLSLYVSFRSVQCLSLCICSFLFMSLFLYLFVLFNVSLPVSFCSAQSSLSFRSQTLVLLFRLLILHRGCSSVLAERSTGFIYSFWLLP